MKIGTPALNLGALFKLMNEHGGWIFITISIITVQLHICIVFNVCIYTVIITFVTSNMSSVAV